MDNPIRFIDPDGMMPWPLLPLFKGYARRHEDNFGAPRDNGRTHKGVDMNYAGAGEKDKGAPVVATHDGYVESVHSYSDDKDGGGNRITIRSKDGTVETSYMHLDNEPNVKKGDKITEGQNIGEMGKSGQGKSDAYPSHLHYELREKNADGTYEKVNPIGKDGEPVDPQKILKDDEKFSTTGEDSKTTTPTPALKPNEKLRDNKSY